MNINIIETTNGGLNCDDRGIVRFVNTFNFQNVKRFYQVTNSNLSTIRAFHGHMKEGKYVYVVSGSIILCAVPLSKIKSPSKKTRVERFILSAHKPQIILIPPGYANGFRSLEKGTEVLFFSTTTLEESKDDDYRYPYDYWGKKIWEVENR